MYIDYEGLISHLNKNYRNRLKILAMIEEMREHHLVRDNAEFYVNENGELKGRLKKDNELFYAERLQVEGRIAKLHPLLTNFNQTYKKLQKIVLELPKDKALRTQKECIKESIKLYDEINDLLVKDLKAKNKLDENFEGRIDLSKLKNIPKAKKVTLTVLKQYIEYETKVYEELEAKYNEQTK